MSEHLIPGDLAELLEAPEHDVRRRHVAECARCRAQLAAYAKFMAAPADRPGTNLADARQRLGAALEREFRAEAPGAVRRPLEQRGPEGWLRALLGPRPGPTWAAAAAVLVVGFVLASVYVVRRDRAEDTLRGATPGSADGVVEIEPARTGPGTIELRWHGVRGADAYQVSLLATDLAPIATVSGTRDTVAVLRLRDLAPGVHPGDLLYGRVVAFRMGSPIAASRPMTLRAP